jgi:predicted nucleotidyltransferase
MNAAEALEIIRDRIVKGFAPERIVLFGSVARGEAGPDSDLDLLVVFDRVEDKGYAQASIYNALRGIPFPKDVFVVTEKETAEKGRNKTLDEALLQGRIIYDRRLGVGIAS